MDRLVAFHFIFAIGWLFVLGAGLGSLIGLLLSVSIGNLLRMAFNLMIGLE